MRITDEMVKAAGAVVPSLTQATVRRMLEAAALGQFVLMEGEGQQVIDGKSRFPALAQIVVNDPLVALDLAQQLTSGARSAIAQKTEQAHITLFVAGDGYCSE